MLNHLRPRTPGIHPPLPLTPPTPSPPFRSDGFRTTDPVEGQFQNPLTRSRSTSVVGCIEAVYVLVAVVVAAAVIAAVAGARRFVNGTGLGCYLAADIVEASPGWVARRRTADYRSLTAGAVADHQVAAGWDAHSAVGGRGGDGELFLVSHKHRDSCR